MVHIKIDKGLDIPIKGKPEGEIKLLVGSGESFPLDTPHLISLNLSTFDDVKFKLLVKAEDVVKIGQPLAEDKSHPGRFFVSPASGHIKEIRRGLKRRLLDIVIEVSQPETYEEFDKINAETASREQIIELMKKGGIFSHIRSRPFNFLADPSKTPKSIFVKCIESAPFLPPAEMQVKGYEKEFNTGLQLLAKLTDGAVHLVHHKKSSFKPFIEALHVQRHTAEGPHPIANASVHIHYIDPIRKVDEVIWTLTARDVVQLGYLAVHGKYLIEKVISLAGPGMLPEKIGFFKVREGFPIAGLISGRIPKGDYRLISGDVLTGHKVEADDFLGFEDLAFCVVAENYKRQFLHFFRLGTDKYSFSRAYLSGHLNNQDRQYNFTTNQHGEHRAFMDSSLLDKVQPLPVPTMLLVKAIAAEDYELAERYGLIEVDSEDFALPTFVDPSKNEMVGIVKKGLRQYAQENLG